MTAAHSFFRDSFIDWFIHSFAFTSATSHTWKMRHERYDTIRYERRV